MASDNVRVLNTTTQTLSNVVHRRSAYISTSTKCHVKGGWTLRATTDAVSCSSCIRRMH